MRIAPRLLVSAILLTLPSPALAQSPPEPRRLAPPRISTPITLDGRLDESVWETAALAKGFLQNDLREGVPAAFDTEVRVLYDADAIYLGVFTGDDAPQKLIVSELRNGIADAPM